VASIPGLSREQVVAYRLDAQGLRERADAGGMVAVARTICVQNTPPGAAGQALSARVDDVGEDDVAAALEDDKSLLQSFGARAAPHVFATADAAVFTLGLLPDGEEALRTFLQGARPALDAVELRATDLVELAGQAVEEVLDGTALVKDDLGRAVGELLTDRVPRAARKAWTSKSDYAERQFLGESLVRFALPVTSLRGTLCHGDRQGRSPLLYRTDQWLGTDPVRKADADAARTGLLRRYLHCYGPSTPEHFAAWGGIATEQAQAAWAQIRGDLCEVSLAGTTTWIHRDDADHLAAPPQPAGVRLLPPHDPYLQARDRETLLADRSLHRRVWRSTGMPGGVLVDGRLLATWRPRARRRTLDLRVETLGDLPDSAADPIREEAERLAAHRGRELGSIEGL
jgi:hypothetical protein